MLSASMNTVPSFDKIEDDVHGQNGNSVGLDENENKPDRTQDMRDPVDRLLNDPNNISDDDDWGVVVTTVDSNELESTGILIVPPAEHDEMLSLASRSKATPTLDGQAGHEAPSHEEVSLRVEDDDIESEVQSLDPTPPSPEDENKPTDQVTMELPVKDEPSKLSSQEDHSLLDRDESVTDQSDADRKLSERLQMADEISSLMMKTSPAAGSEAKNSNWHNQLALLVTAFGLFSVVVMGGMSMLESQRQKFEASNSLLEERILTLQTKLMEQEKAQDLQRQAEFAVLKEEFKQALQEREKALARKQEESRQLAQEPDEMITESARSRGNSSMKFPSMKKFSFASFSFSSHLRNDSQFHFPNASKLGKYAEGTRKEIRSKLQDLGRSLWIPLQENFVGPASSNWRKIQTNVKEKAERVVEDLTTSDWTETTGNKPNNSYFPPSSSPLHPRHYQRHESRTTQSVNTTGTKSTNFRSVAATIVSSVALASIATVVADKTVSYISSYGDDE